MTEVLVIFGGRSSEYEVACRSAAYVTDQIDREKYEVHTVGVTKEGRWLYTTAATEQMADYSWEQLESNRPCVLSPDTALHGLQFADGEQMSFDVVFPVMHGKNGEDGAIAALCQMAGLPQVGCSMTSGAICMDKMITKVICEKYDIPQAKWAYCFAKEVAEDAAATADRLMAEMGEYPVFVKPCSAGSSVGIGKAKNKEDLISALKEAARHDFKIVVEAFIEGQEVEVAVLGSRFDPVVSYPGEIAPTAEFYSYDAKYNDDSSALFIPARLDKSVMEQLRGYAAKIFKILDCAGMSRVDFFATKNGILFNEINTIPGHTVISMYPKLMAAHGIEGKACMTALIEGALERGIE